MPETKTSPQPIPLLKVPDVVALSGMSESTIWRELKSGSLKSFRFGRMVRIDQTDYEAWVASKRAKESNGRSSRAA